MKLRSTPLGLEVRSDNRIIFFGNRNSQREELRAFYPELSWCFARQVHGIQVRSVSSSEVNEFKEPLFVGEADALLCQDRQLALEVRTADCMPILGYSTRSAEIIAIHAGWKGFVSGIFGESSAILKQKGLQLSEMIWFLGPHLMAQSFCVKGDVLEQFHHQFGKSFKAYGPGGWIVKQAVDTKDGQMRYWIDLALILEAKVREQGGKLFQIRADTLGSTGLDTGESWNSHRGGAKAEERNLSFIANV